MEQAEAELDRAGAQLECIQTGATCDPPAYGDKVAEGPSNVIIQLVEAGRKCGMSQGATIQAIGHSQARLFWKGINAGWTECFERGALDLGEAGRSAVQKPH